MKTSRKTTKKPKPQFSVRTNDYTFSKIKRMCKEHGVSQAKFLLLAVESLEAQFEREKESQRIHSALLKTIRERT